METETIILPGGQTILEAFTHAIKIATDLNMNVEFDFNAVLCTARPNSNPMDGSDSYTEAIRNFLTVASS